MLAVTAYLSTDISPIPLLWILPLSLYLLTFIMAFGSDTGRLIRIARRSVPLLVLPLVMLMVAHVSGSLWYIVPCTLPCSSRSRWAVMPGSPPIAPHRNTSRASIYGWRQEA